MRFLEFIQLDEAAGKSISRLLRQAGGDKLVVTMSASRGGKEVYTGATKDLEKDIQSAGQFGIVKTIGGYREDREGEDPEDVQELSLVISHPNENVPPQKILQFFIKLAHKYQQEGVIIKMPGEVDAYEYYTDPSKSPVKYGQPGFSKDTPWFTRLRKGQDPKHRRIAYNPSWPEE